MEHWKQRRVEEERERFERLVDHGPALWAQLIKAGFVVTSARRLHADPDRPSSWLLYVQPSEALLRRFDLAPEVLAVVSPFDVAQARDIDEAETELARTHRLDRGVVLFVTREAGAAQRLGGVIPWERRYVTVTFDALLDAPDPQHWAVELLANDLGAMRPFAPGAPVVDAQFFGRGAELLELERRLLRQSTPVGLFGLRKVGKSSLLQSLFRKFERDADASGPVAVTLHCDLHAVPPARKNLPGLLRALLLSAREAAQRWPALGAAHPALRDAPLREEELVRTASDAVEALTAWCRSQGRKLIVAVDEYERLLDATSVSVREGLDFLEYLRGLNQQHPTAFNHVFVGLSRRLANTHRFEGRQNPLFGAYFAMPLGGLTREELGGMVRRLGRRASLDFHHEAVDRIAAESGGHPFLARTLADLIDLRAPASRARLVPVGAASIEAEVPAFDEEVRYVMSEIADAVEELGAPGSLTAVVDALAAGGWSGLSPGFVEDLRRYGIVAAAPERVRIGVFGRWLHRNVAPSRRAAHG